MMSWFAVAAILLLVSTHSVLSQGTGTFIIGGQMYPSQNGQYDAFYVYDRSRGSPAPFSFTCTSTRGGLLDGSTTNELISGSLIGTTVVDNVTITGSTSGGGGGAMLEFDPEFLPRFSGVYEFQGDGVDVQVAVMITTENPFLRLNMGPVIVTGNADMFNITVMGAYTASGGVSQRPTRDDYRLVYFLGGEAVAVQGLMFVMDTNPYERVFLVDVGQNVQNGTNFNLTLSVSGLATSVIFPVIVQDLPQLPDKIILQEGSTLTIDCTPTSMATLVWSRDGVTLQTTSSILVIEGTVESDSGTYTCSAFGITRQVPVYILPAISNGLAIQYNGSFVPDQYVINEFDDMFTLICVGTQGNGELAWFAEMSQATESELANIRGQAGNFSGSFVVDGVEITVVYSRNEARLTASLMMSSLYTVTFKCYSGESQVSTRVLTTTGDPYVVMLPSTPRSAVIGQMVTISYTVATAFESFLTLQHTFNGSVIPNPVPSPNNAQLRQYSFIANTSSEGTYILSLTGSTPNGGVSLLLSFDLDIIVPTLAAQPAVVYLRNGDNVSLNCTPSDLRASVTWFRGPSTENQVITPDAMYRFDNPTLRHSLSFTVRLNEWDEGGEFPSGINPAPASLGLRQVLPMVANAVTNPPLSYNCGLMDGQTVVNEQTIAFNTLREPVQIIYALPTQNTFLYNDAVLNGFPQVDPSFSLRCVTLNSHENPRWSTDNLLLANFLSTQQNDTVQTGSTNVTLLLQNSREQELQFNGIFDMQLSGNYSCASQTSRQSSNLTLTTSNYVSCTNGSSVTALLGSATFLEFQVAGLDSDGGRNSVGDLTVFEGNFTAVSMAAASQPGAGYDVVYHTHPNGVIFYFEVVEAQDAGEYRLSYIFGTATAAVSLSVDTSIILTAPVTSVNVREGQMSMNFFCTPSDNRVQLQWEFFEFGFSTPVTLFTPPRTGVPIRPPPIFPIRTAQFDSSGQTVHLTNAQPTEGGIYRCSVAGDTGMLVTPVNISVTVIRRCANSYAAGVIWGPAFGGDIQRFPCSQASSQFSLVVTMSRECRTIGQWSSVDFSSCTLQSANEPPFLLIWLLLRASAVGPRADQFATEISTGVSSTGGVQVSDPVVQILPGYLIRGSDFLENTVPLLYSARINESDIAGVNIAAIHSYLNGLNVLQGISISNSDNKEVAGFQKSDNCECRRHGFTLFTDGGSVLIGDRVDRVQEICAETISSPCNCSLSSCVCTSPYVGNGIYCSLDSDGDQFPEVPVRNCTDSERQQAVNYCVMDSCPTVFNVLHNDTTPCNDTSAQVVSVCPREVDTEYGIAWGYTAPGNTSMRSCGANYTGTARRLCRSDATWAPPDVSQCENVAITMLRITAEELFSNVTVADDATVAMALGVVSSLATFTEPTTISIFPSDLNTSNFVITNTVDLLFMNLDQSGTTDVTASTEVVRVIDNLLNPVNLAGFQDLQAEAPASQSVLNNAERYALYLATAMSQNTSEQAIILSRGNIVIRSERITVSSGTQPRDVIFPQEGDLENFTISSGVSPAVINIPFQLIEERSNSSTVPVAHTQFQSLQDFLPPELNNSTAVPVSLIISSQVAVQSGVSMGSRALQENPVTISFIVEGATNEHFSCVFWNFSDPIGSGGWSTEGVTTVQVTQDGNITLVQCNSIHLTSFAVLVNVAGTPVDSLALNIISYIGLGISLSCLLLTIIFFLSLGKKLLKEVHNFVHLNLAIALFLGYLTFAIGVQLAASNKAACQAVTAIMQYFFLASFCWMLCEGIMLYLMLVLVFSRLSKKWWFFFLLGWIPPIIFVVIGLTTVLNEYVVYSRNDAGEILTDDAGNDIISFCWLSSGNGTNAIWTFVAPMLAIVLINSVFLILVLVSVFRNRGHRMSEMKEKGKRVDLVVTIVKASLILLPLLGLTWVLGLFAVNQNTLVFAWLFTIFNSLQGAFIFVFHVLRSERVWGRIKKKYKVYSSTHSKAGDKGTASTSGGKKTSGVANSSGGESTLEMKEKTVGTIESTHYAQFEPNDDTIKKPISDDDVAAVIISETTLSAERPAEEEAKDRSGPTSDEPTSDAVETTAVETVLTDNKESMKVVEEVGFSGGQENLLVEVSEEEELTVKEAAAGHVGDVGVSRQPHLLKMRGDEVGATVRRKEFHTELLSRRNEELRKRMESVLGVTLSGDTAEPIRDDILLCRLMNKLHPGMIHEETSGEKRIHNIAEFITACKKLNVPEHKLCTAGDIIEGKNTDSVIACLEYLLESSSL